MRFKSRIKVPTVVTAPLFLAQVGFLMFYFKDWWSYHSPLVWLWGAVAGPLIVAYYLLWTPAGMIYLLVCASTTAWAWRERHPDRTTRVLLVLVSVVTFLGITYDIWWYVTGQVFEQLA